MLQRANRPAEVIPSMQFGGDAVHVHGTVLAERAVGVPLDDATVEHAVDAGRVLPGAGPDLGPLVLGRQVGGGGLHAVGGEDGGQELPSHAETQPPPAWREHAGLPECLEDEAIFPQLPVVERRALQPVRPI